MISLFDERWYERNNLEYAEFLQAEGIGELHALIYSPGYWDEKLLYGVDELVRVMHTRGVRVFGVFNTCRRVDGFPYFDDSFADIKNMAWQQYVLNTIMERSIPVDGIGLDFVRTTDVFKENTSVMAKFINRIYRTYKNIYPNKDVTCYGRPWGEPSIGGRDCTRWANEGYMDRIYCMNYGNETAIGDDPNMANHRKAQAKTRTPCVPIVSCYQRKNGESVPSDRWDQIPNKVVFDDYMIYTGWLFKGLASENLPPE